MELMKALEEIGVDAQTTLYRFGGNAALMEKFVKKFCDDETYGKLEQAVRDKDYKGIENMAHTLKGVSANLGFEQLSAYCNDAVWDVRNDTLDKLESDFSKVSSEYQKIVDVIRKL